MKTSTPRTARIARGRPLLRLRPVALSCALLAVGAADVALAQQAEQQVSVTGIRRAIESAISTKKSADGVVEALSAEDVGKLPDATVAEAISRLPGVTVQADTRTGRAKYISLRGLSVDFTGGLLNGREQASTGDSRGVEFDLYPAELLGQLLVYKTPDAAMVGTGLAGTVDMRTIRPLDFSKRVVAVNARTQKTGMGLAQSGDGDRQSVSYIDQFANRTVGVVLGYTKQKDKGAIISRFEGWGTATVNGLTVPAGFNDDLEQDSAKREGLMAALQYKPNKDFETMLDLFKSKNQQTKLVHRIQGPICGGAGGYDPDGVLSATTVAGTVATSGTCSNFKGVLQNNAQDGVDTLDSIGWNTRFKLGDWRLTADLSQSKVKRDFTRFESYAGIPGDYQKNLGTTGPLGSISWTNFDGSNLAATRFSTSQNYADPALIKLTDVQGWGGGPSNPQPGYFSQPVIQDKVDHYRFSAKRDLSWGAVNGVEFGANFTQREKSKVTAEGSPVIKGGNPYAGASLPASSTMVGAAGVPFATYTPIGLMGSAYDLKPWVGSLILAKNFSVTERVLTSFVKADLDTKLFGFDVRGNVGGQLANTKQTVRGVNIDVATCGAAVAGGQGEKDNPGCVFSPTTASHSFTDFNPSLNLSADLGNDQQLRFGLARVLARPNMADMSSNITLGYDGAKNVITAIGGNPKLEPFRAKALDLAYEKYFGTRGYYSVGAFYKKLDTYIVRAGVPFDPAPYLVPGVSYPTTQGLYTQPRNLSGGSLHGVEVAVNLPFSMLSKSLDGFGMFVNGGITESDITLPTDGLGNVQNAGGDKVPLPGLSKTVVNARFYYEKSGWTVSLAGRYRSDFLGDLVDFQDNGKRVFIKGQTTVDLQAGYEFAGGVLNGLSVTAQVNNLTDPALQTYEGTPDKIKSTVKFGKTYQLGVNYKF